MNTALIPMTAEEAALALQDFGEPSTDEDKMMAKAYRLMKQGKRVLNLYETFRKAGCNTEGLPRLAIAPARATEIFLHYKGANWQHVWFSMERWREKGSYRGQFVAIPKENVPGIQPHNPADWKEFPRAVVPQIPPKYRPSDLYPFFLLWDAKWEAAKAPIDPILLKKIGGPLYLVVAAWDLTPLERSLLKTKAK